ncbi:MAG: aminotransferase class V-fold PLP-dependent enzyme [Gammaproteobacteria bacterium]
MTADIRRDISAEFPLDANIHYLNHAAVAPWPRRAAVAVEQFAEENTTKGARGYSQWLRVEAALREQLRALLNAPHADDIALLKNTSEGLSVVAHGLDWRAGDNIVISDEEFPSNRIVWESLQDRGVTVREASLRDGDDPEASLLAHIDERTRLLAISSVQYASGIRLDLQRLGDWCHDRGILYCIDAIQSLGVLPMDVQAVHADFVAADGHKWLLGPEGLAVFYCRASVRDQLRLHQYGWHMLERAGDFDQRVWQPARSARRFECGSPNMLGIHALHASLSLLLELGIDLVARLALDNAAYLLEELGGSSRLELITPTARDRHAGIVTFRLRDADPLPMWQYLTEQGVVCAQRGGGIRLSPHFYNNKNSLEKVVQLISGYRS